MVGGRGDVVLTGRHEARAGDDSKRCSRGAAPVRSAGVLAPDWPSLSTYPRSHSPVTEGNSDASGHQRWVKTTIRELGPGCRAESWGGRPTPVWAGRC